MNSNSEEARFMAVGSQQPPQLWHATYVRRNIENVSLLSASTKNNIREVVSKLGDLTRVIIVGSTAILY